MAERGGLSQPRRGSSACTLERLFPSRWCAVRATPLQLIVAPSGSAFKMLEMKNLSLILLALQNCSQMLLMRFAVTHNSYLSSTAVVMQEFIKLCISLSFLVIIDGNTPQGVVSLVKQQVFDRPSETAKMAVPGVLYAIQNNLLYVLSPRTRDWHAVRLLTC